MKTSALVFMLFGYANSLKKDFQESELYSDCKCVDTCCYGESTFFVK